MPENRLTAARRRLKAWRDKRAEEKAAPHRETQRRMLGVLNRDGFLSRRSPTGNPMGGQRPRHLYETGSANRNAVAKRRRKAKMARKSRRINRGK